MVGCMRGRLAQLAEHRHHKPGVTGSSPVPPIEVTQRARSIAGAAEVSGARISRAPFRFVEI